MTSSYMSYVWYIMICMKVDYCLFGYTIRMIKWRYICYWLGYMYTA